MTIKEQQLATLRGEPCECLPFVPRLNNWFWANQKSGTLPDRFKNASLIEITDELGFGFHTLTPDFQDYRVPDGDVNVGIGLYDTKLTPYYVTLHNVGVTLTREANGRSHVTYDTPYGKLSTRFVYDQRMVDSGISISVVTEPVLKSHEDFPAMMYIYENAEVTPNYENLAYYRDHVIGDRGLTMGLSSVYGSPLHLMLKELMSLETFYVEMIEYEDEMMEFHSRVLPFMDKLLDCAANAPCDMVLAGSNYDCYVTAPAFYRDHIMPTLQKRGKLLEEKGKYMVCHPDGENRGLLELLSQSGFHIADSICPAPMTSYSLAQIREAFGDKLTIWGGIPSICTLENSMSQRDFEKFVDDTLSSLGRGDHLIFSVADTLPPAADFDRVLYLAKKIKEFGPVNP